MHIRVASPPLRYPCYMGINIPTREELIANKMDETKLAKHVSKYYRQYQSDSFSLKFFFSGADSLAYLSVEGLVKAVRHGISPAVKKTNAGHCTACLTGEYPEKLEW